MANDSIQANLKPATVERIAKIADKPVTRGIDKMINKCIDELEKRNCSEWIAFSKRVRLLCICLKS